ncbi:MAG TPA: Crp/Fnr family transcriptional regulator [Thermoanaerobaculia bacterium]|nr:Crp/Fnr family transcriptional regulator [Thermoanaerobaculia bacterium]
MTIPVEQVIRGNLLLSQLAVHERNAIHRAAEAVSLVAGESLLNATTRTSDVFFPTTCVVSVVRTLRDGRGMELALIGSEGMVGLDVFTAARTHLDDAIVMSAGCAYRLPAEELRNQLRRGGGLQKALLRFMRALFAQVAQTAVCSRFHAPEARLARWLMLVSDRTSSLELRVDASAATSMLAIDHDRAAVAIDRLRALRAISLRDDRITITSRETLEVSACECYETLREEYERTLAT